MNIEKLQHILSSYPGFRLKQAYQSIFADLITNWDQNTTLPKALREELAVSCPLDIPVTFSDSKNTDTLKALITLPDGSEIETVLMFHKDGRRTVCISSQVGCSLGCRFCATGTLGRKRNVTVSEMIMQVLLFARYLKAQDDPHPRITNIVFMGMGEPFLNYDAVLETLRLLNQKEVFGIGARHMSVSTSGIIDGIEKFTDEPMQINLAISLHAPNNELRSQLMPINRKYPLKDLMAAVKAYRKKRNRQVMFEYIMLDGINDTVDHAEELAALMQDSLYMVNLIRYNPTGVFQPSSARAIATFKQILEDRGVRVTQRHTFGSDIDAACGQLAANKRKKRKFTLNT